MPPDFATIESTGLDATRALQGLLDAMPAKGDEIRLPRGQFVVTDTLRIVGKHGWKLSGAGLWATSLLWRGPPGKPVLSLEGCAYSEVSDLGFGCEGSASAAIRQGGSPQGGAALPMFNRFHRLQIAGPFRRGISLEPPDANNDKCVFDQVWIQHATECGVFLGHSQCKAHLFTGCTIVSSNIGVDCAGGSFNWQGGVMGNNADADFRIGVQTDPISITNLNSESSRRLLRTYDTLISIAMPVTIQGCRFDTDGLAADGYAVDLRHYGPLTLIGNRFGTRRADVKFRVCTPGGDTQYAQRNVPAMVAIGNDFVSTKRDATAADFFHRWELSNPAGPLRATALGNTINYVGDGEAFYQRMPDVVPAA